jgi:hypothetical protein
MRRRGEFFRNLGGDVDTTITMKSYPGVVVSVDDSGTTVRLEQTGHEILFEHDGFNAIPAELRRVGETGYVMFPKAPPLFARVAA